MRDWGSGQLLMLLIAYVMARELAAGASGGSGDDWRKQSGFPEAWLRGLKGMSSLRNDAAGGRRTLRAAYAEFRFLRVAPGGAKEPFSSLAEKGSGGCYEPPEK